jgi:hypothetical protein
MDRKAAMGLLLAGVVAVGGCGGDSGKGSSEATAPAPTRSGTSPSGATGQQDEQKKDASPGSDQKNPAKKKSRLERALERLPRKKRIASIKHAVLTAAGFNGLLKVTVTVAADGHSVTIAVPANVACTARPDADARTVSLIKRDIPVVKSVAVNVGSRTFAAFRPGCKAQNVPGGSGSVVYSKNGIGNADSPAFKITAKKWTVAYRNDDGFFSVFVYKNGKAQKDVISTFKGSSGTKTFTGPGTFKLKISGGSPWAVTARNGA